MRHHEPSGALRLCLVALVWLGLTKGALDYGAGLLPRSVAAALSLPSFLLLALTLTTALGLALAAVVLESPAAELGIRLPSGRQLTVVALATPSIFVAAFTIGFGIALPTLLAEIRRGGAEAPRQNLGELGHAVKEAPIYLTLLWAAVVSPIGEELLFRGALWSAVERLTRRRAPIVERDVDPELEGLPSALFTDGVAVRAGRRLLALLRSGGYATLATAALFALMHADLHGGVGILRLVSAACLGLACGTVRHATGSVVAAAALHVIYNVLSIGQSRHWFVSDALPSLYGMPLALVVLAGVLSAILLVLALVWRRGTRSPAEA